MQLRLLPERLSVCKFRELSENILKMPLCFLARTDEELSFICPTAFVPEGTLARDDGWRTFRIEGILDFSLVGILAKITGLLAEANIPLSAVSTYNTDYILVKEENLAAAMAVLKGAGYDFFEENG